jgi:hypothetical protein
VGFRVENRDWPVIYINLPTGEVSWHIPATQAPQFDDEYNEYLFLTGVAERIQTRSPFWLIAEASRLGLKTTVSSHENCVKMVVSLSHNCTVTFTVKTNHQDYTGYNTDEKFDRCQKYIRDPKL